MEQHPTPLPAWAETADGAAADAAVAANPQPLDYYRSLARREGGAGAPLAGDFLMTWDGRMIDLPAWAEEDYAMGTGIRVYRRVGADAYLAMGVYPSTHAAVRAVEQITGAIVICRETRAPRWPRAKRAWTFEVRALSH